MHFDTISRYKTQPMNHPQHDNGHHRHHGAGDDRRTMIDPVCGMKVDPERAAGSAVHDGRTYYFCGKGCLAKFTADPERYAAGRASPPPAATPAARAGQWTCPMHPQIVRDGPGDCPICGMALEPVAPSGEESDRRCHPSLARACAEDRKKGSGGRT